MTTNGYGLPDDILEAIVKQARQSTEAMGQQTGFIAGAVWMWKNAKEVFIETFINQ